MDIGADGTGGHGGYKKVALLSVRAKLGSKVVVDTDKTLISRNL